MSLKEIFTPFKEGFFQAFEDAYFLLNFKGHFNRASALVQKQINKNKDSKLKL